jgi:Domain of unknown function (DUF1851)
VPLAAGHSSQHGNNQAEMMFEVFERNFSQDSNADGIGIESDVSGLGEFIEKFGGASFRHGLYRAVRATELQEWTKRLIYAFPVFQGRITCFGYDWLGRAFAIDSQRVEEGRLCVVMFEPGAGRALEISANIESFHDNELNEFGEAVLAISFYREWLENGGHKPGYAQCIGYKKPLFLGGKDDLTNLELTDLDVYWHIFGQLITRTKGLPLGTSVRAKLS